MGFRSPLFLLGLSRLAAVARGFRTPLPFWNAGVPVTVTKGFRTPLPFWNAGVVAIPIPVEDEQVYPYRGYQQQIMQEEEELIIMCRALLEITYRCR